METPAVILIGGVAGGLGQALAQAALSQGWRVAGYGRRTAPALPAGVDYHVADATQPGAVEAVVRAVEARAGRVDAYVHALGSIYLKPAHLTSDADWDQVLALNLTSAFRALRAVLEPMRRQRAGSVVLVSSVAARLGLANHEAIAAAKAGVEGLVRAAAASYASQAIRVNAVAPGLVETPLAAALLANPASRAASEKMHPLGRIGQPADLASAILWLAGAQSSWVSGQVLGIDGGLSTLRPRSG